MCLHSANTWTTFSFSRLRSTPSIDSRRQSLYSSRATLETDERSVKKSVVDRSCAMHWRCVESHRGYSIPSCPTNVKNLLSALSVSEVDAATLANLNGLTAGAQTKMGAPLFPKMKKLPPDIQAARDKALGIERKPETPATPKAKKIKLKVFQAVPFQSGIITSVQTGETQTLTVDVGSDTAIVIGGNQLPTYLMTLWSRCCCRGSNFEKTLKRYICVPEKSSKLVDTQKRTNFWS